MDDKKYMNISLEFVLGLDRILDYISKNDSYIAQFGLIQIKYEGTFSDTTNGAVEKFTITRKKGE